MVLLGPYDIGIFMFNYGAGCIKNFSTSIFSLEAHLSELQAYILGFFMSIMIGFFISLAPPKDAHNLKDVLKLMVNLSCFIVGVVYCYFWAVEVDIAPAIIFIPYLFGFVAGSSIGDRAISEQNNWMRSTVGLGTIPGIFYALTPLY